MPTLTEVEEEEAESPELELVTASPSNDLELIIAEDGHRLGQDNEDGGEEKQQEAIDAREKDNKQTTSRPSSVDGAEDAAAKDIVVEGEVAEVGVDGDRNGEFVFAKRETFLLSTNTFYTLHPQIQRLS
jgi:hypothetical protein